MDKNIENEENIFSLVSNEVEIMSSISHPNIINLINYSFTDSLVKPNGDSKDVYYLVLELATNGEMFDFLAETGAFSEEIARYYFHQLIDALEYLNLNGISHRDIKPENMMFDWDYNLKLADFGFSSSQPLNQSRKGTVSYMAPEVYEGLVYNGHWADLFSAGVILFLMISRHPPFYKAWTSDPHYKLIMGNRQDIFWKVHSKNKPDKYYSKSLKEFISWLLSFNPMERPSLAEIKTQEWYNGPIPSSDIVKEEFKWRKLELTKENYQPEHKIPTGKPDPTIIGTGAFRSADGKDKRELAPYIAEFKRYTQFFSTSDPEILFSTLALYVDKKFKEVKFERDLYS